MSDGRFSWTNAMIVRLIKEYQKHPCLWDPNNESYRIFPTKYEAWEEVASIFGVEVFDIKKKLNSILASHRRERSKIRNGGRSNWFLYDHLGFVPMHLDNPPNSKASTPKKSIQEDDFEDEPAHDHDEEEEDDHDDDGNQEDHMPEYLELTPVEGMDEEVFIKQEPAGQRHYSDRPKRIKRSVRTLRPIKRKLVTKVKHTVESPEKPTIGLDARVLQALKNIRKADLLKKKDECDSFGEYIANSLRKHNERTRSMIKHAINNILFEQEMKKFSFNQVHMTETVEENPLILTDLQES